MISRFFFLKQPVDLKIVTSAGAAEDGFCWVIGNDYYEAEEEYDICRAPADVTIFKSTGCFRKKKS